MSQLFAPTPAPGSSRLSHQQLGMIHGLSKKAGLVDAQYRTILRGVAQVESAKDLDQSGFERVMAIIEETGHLGTYWQDRLARDRSGQFANPRMLHKINELYDAYLQAAQDADTHPDDVYVLAGLIHRTSKQRTRELAQLKPQEAWNLIEELKAILERAPTKRVEKPRHQDLKDKEAEALCRVQVSDIPF